MELALRFEAYDVRVVSKNGETWFVLSDVCTVLEIGNTSDAARRLDEDERGIDNIDTPSGSQEMLIVSEPGLYKILQTSRKPQAKRFDRWVRHEVLPEIRKTGGYRGNIPTLTDISELFDEKIAPMHRDIANVRLEITEVQKNVIFISKRIDDIVPRRDFTEEARRQFKRVAAEKYDNECPCCRKTKLTHGEYQYDHFLGRELRDPEHGWITCKKCNLKMASDALFKASRRPHFEVFQELRRQMFGEGPPPKSRKGSPTTSSGGQGNLFA
jgi:prophage antirepressor-like protein